MPLASISEFVNGVLQSQLLDAEQRAELQQLQSSSGDTRQLAQELLRRDWLTAYQINQILQGKAATLMIGPYILLERIGEGGMGQVFKARQKMLNRVVALKVIRKECLKNPKVTLRFQREIRAAGQLSHPHIVRAYDADQVNGTYYIAMEFIEGVDLARLVKDNGPVPVDQACEYIRQAALGLQHAFERGMVHRDIKPANLLVTRAVASDRRRSSGLIQRPVHLNAKRSSSAIPRLEAAEHYPWGIVKILDMGLARCTDPFTGRSSTHLTQIGAVMGTPEFIAPEQARDSHTSDIRADLYSLGCTLYFLLTGQPPFAGGTLTEKLLQHQLDEAEPVGEVRREKLLAWKGPQGPANISEAVLHVPVAVDGVLRRLLSKRPEQRYQTPVELAHELQEILKQMADGTLPKVEEQSLAPSSGGRGRNGSATESFLVEAGANPAPVSDTQAMEPIVRLPDKPSRANRYAGKIALALASLGGVAFLALVTVVAIVLSRGNLTQASMIDPEPGAKVKENGAPYWKTVLKQAIHKRASWEEARLEVQRHRALLPVGTQAKQIDDLLAKMPTPFDSLERAKFDSMMPPGLPPEVIAMYGYAKPNAVKPVTSVAVSPNGRWLIANEENGIRLFDLLGSVIPYKIVGHTGRVNQVLLSPDGRLLASASQDGTVRLWNVASRQRLFSLEKHQKPITQIAFNHDGTLLASAGRDRAIRLWDPRTGAEIRKLDSQSTEVSALAFAPDGQEIFWGDSTKEIRWSSVKSGVGSRNGKFDTKFPIQRVLAFQPHGKLLLAGGSRGLLHVCIWDGKTLTEKTTLKGHQQVNQAAFAPNGKTFVTVGSDPSVTLWDAQALKSLKSLNTLRTPGHSAAFSPDGRHLVIGAAQNQAFVLRLANHDMDVLKAAALALE